MEVVLIMAGIEIATGELVKQSGPNVKINLNAQVLVEPNDLGWKIYDDYWSKYPLKSQPPRHEKHLKLHIWELANIFGSKLYNGCEIPFTTTNMELLPFAF